MLVFAITLSNCQKPSGDHPSPLTATEVFDLRTKCTQLGDKLLGLYPVNAPLTHEQTSRYDSIANRCYVEIFVHKMDLSEPRWNDDWAQTVFDGQSRETLAWIAQNKGKINAWIKDGPDNPTGTQTILKIKALMTDDPDAERAYRLSILSSSLQQH